MTKRNMYDKINITFEYTEKYSSGRRGVTRNLVGRESVAWVQIPPSQPTKNALLSNKTKVRFLNDVCLRQMMLASSMMTASPNDACLTAHYGKHRIIATNGSNIIFAK